MSDNVVELKKKEKPATEEPEKTKEELSFEEIERANKEKKARMERERLAANKNVLRSYRIKS